ncbi:MAG: helix-turn-helix domain-containing protein [Bacteroidales bacterium]|jgi:predicted DNA-binding transcriptional regulator AlpA|nr:helix-turn-helix domain-containing protein [Bacteroidales bacterium]
MENEAIISKAVLSELRQIKSLLFQNKTVFNVEDLSQYTGLSKSKIYKLLSKNLIPTGNNSNIRQKFFYKKDIDEWLMGLSPEDLKIEEAFNQSLSRNRKSGQSV